MLRKKYTCSYCQYTTNNLDDFFRLEEQVTNKSYILCESCLEAMHEYESEIDEDEEEYESTSDSSFEDDYDSDE